MSAEFFTDRNRGSRHFPEALERAGLIVHRHRDHFVDDVDDVDDDVWLPAVAERGWVALSFDKSIRKNELERDAVFTSGARLIVLTGASADAEQLARNFINTSRKVLEFLEREPAPFIARVKRPSPLSEIGLGKAGTIEMVLSSAEWERKYGW